jgi:hypothetical protein
MPAALTVNELRKRPTAYFAPIARTRTDKRDL